VQTQPESPTDSADPDEQTDEIQLFRGPARRKPLRFSNCIPKFCPKAYSETLILRIVEGMTGPEIFPPELASHLAFRARQSPSRPCSNCARNLRKRESRGAIESKNRTIG